MTRVVNIHYNNFYNFYIGRKGKGKDGYFGNPHPVYQEGKPWTECKICKCRHSRGESVLAYKKDFDRLLETDPVFKYKIKQLKNGILGCFCRPKNGFKGKLMCHGQVIAGYLDNKNPEEID